MLPEFSTIFLVSAPVATYRECLATFSAQKWFDSMPALVVGLQCAKVF